MDVSGRTWILALLGRKTIDPLSSREVSMIKTDARALIRIANEIERALSSSSEINDESVAVNGDLLRSQEGADGISVGPGAEKPPACICPCIFALRSLPRFRHRPRYGSLTRRMDRKEPCD